MIVLCTVNNRFGALASVTQVEFRYQLAGYPDAVGRLGVVDVELTEVDDVDDVVLDEGFVEEAIVDEVLVSEPTQIRSNQDTNAMRITNQMKLKFVKLQYSRT